MIFLERILKYWRIGLVVGLSLSGLTGFASPTNAAVAFNTYQVSYTQQTNFDFPLIDARNISQSGSSYSTSQADHDNGVQASAGDEIEFQIYYHNSGVVEDEATNVVIKATLPGGTRNTHEVSASIDSDQTQPVSSSDNWRGGNITIYINGEPQTLEFISGSVRHYPNRSSSYQVPQNADNLVTSGINIGTVRGCFEYSGYVVFRARVGSQAVTNRDLSIGKRVQNLTRGDSYFRDSTVANPSDRLKFEIRFETTGNTSQNNVVVRDILPGLSRLNLVTSSIRHNGSEVSSSFESDFFGSGRNLGTLSSGSVNTITFEATVAGASAFSGGTTLVNTANIRSDQVSTRQDEAEIIIQISPSVSYSLRKTAYNLTQGVEATTVPANPGDIITYTLYYKNTGNTIITGAVIEDNISDVLELAGITNQGGAVSLNSSIRYAPVDVTPGVEITRTFQVQIRDATLFPLFSDLVMVNTYGNEIRVQVRKPEVKGILTPPKTGPQGWLAFSLASVTTFAYWFYRRKITKARAI